MAERTRPRRGTVRLRADGRWEGRARLDARRVYVYARTEQAAWDKLTEVAGPPPPEVPEYVVDESGCWIWQRTLNDRGYGLVCEGGTAKAHRVIYERHRGPIPDGLTIDHLCRVKACVNPDHLDPVTASENTRRQWAWRRANGWSQV